MIKGWADTQNSDVYTQLYKYCDPFLLELMQGLTVQGTQRRGARFLDIRVCWSQDTAMYHTLHFILGSPTEGKPFTSSGSHHPARWYSRAHAQRCWAI